MTKQEVGGSIKKNKTKTGVAEKVMLALEILRCHGSNQESGIIAESDKDRLRIAPIQI